MGVAGSRGHGGSHTIMGHYGVVEKGGFGASLRRGRGVSVIERDHVGNVRANNNNCGWLTPNFPVLGYYGSL